MQSSQTIIRKISAVLKQHDNYLKKPKVLFDTIFGGLFDVTDKKGLWLCSEDRNFYDLQLATGRKVGFATTKIAPKATIHPSKRRKAVHEISSKLAP